VWALTGGEDLQDFGRKVAMQAGFTWEKKHLSQRKTQEFLYFSHKFCFAKFEFILAIRDPKLAWKDLETP